MTLEFFPRLDLEVSNCEAFELQVEAEISKAVRDEMCKSGPLKALAKDRGFVHIEVPYSVNQRHYSMLLHGVILGSKGDAHRLAVSFYFEAEDKPSKKTKSADQSLREISEVIAEKAMKTKLSVLARFSHKTDKFAATVELPYSFPGPTAEKKYEIAGLDFRVTSGTREYRQYVAATGNRILQTVGVLNLSEGPRPELTKKLFAEMSTYAAEFVRPKERAK
jgi:hypothetical protein